MVYSDKLVVVIMHASEVTQSLMLVLLPADECGLAVACTVYSVFTLRKARPGERAFLRLNRL